MEHKFYIFTKNITKFSLKYKLYLFIVFRSNLIISFIHTIFIDVSNIIFVSQIIKKEVCKNMKKIPLQTQLEDQYKLSVQQHC